MAEPIEEMLDFITRIAKCGWHRGKPNVLFEDFQDEALGILGRLGIQTDIDPPLPRAENEEAVSIMIKAPLPAGIVDTPEARQRAEELLRALSKDYSKC